MAFKHRMKELRLRRDMSLTDLGAALGKTESACRAWELGRTKPDADTLIKLAKYFDCTADYLLGLSNFQNENHMKSYGDMLDALRVELSKSQTSETLIIHLLTEMTSLINRVNTESSEKLFLEAYVQMLLQTLNGMMYAYLRILSEKSDAKDDYIDLLRSFSSTVSSANLMKTALVKSLSKELPDGNGLKVLLAQEVSDNAKEKQP